MRKTRNAQDTVHVLGLSEASRSHASRRRVKTCAALGTSALVCAMTVALAGPAVSADPPGTPSQSAITIKVSNVPATGHAPLPSPTPPQTASQTGCCA